MSCFLSLDPSGSRYDVSRAQRSLSAGSRASVERGVYWDGEIIGQRSAYALGEVSASKAAFVLGASSAIGSCCAAYRRRRQRAARAPLEIAAWTGFAPEPKAEWPLDPEDAETLRQVVVVHRHGTRFPTKPPGAGNLSWPLRAQFWASYKGHLTPVGAKQLQDIGSVLRDRYVGTDGGLFRNVDQVDGRAVAVYTSNIQRTLQSAWSFLVGLLPKASIFFAFRSERVFSQALKQSVGVPIYVEDATEGDDRLFHEWKIKGGYKDWNKENLKKSSFLIRAKNDPEYVALLDKLYKLTGEAKLNPKQDPLSRLVGAKDVDTQVMIDEAHNRPVLPNDFGWTPSEKERQMIRQIGDEVKRCWFGDADGLAAISYGKRGAGYLAHKIWRHMNERAEALCHLRFVQFSCHDTTMAALAAHYGIELPEIGFGAFFLFELHEDPHDGWKVKFYYNRCPSAGATSYENLRSFVLPLGREQHLIPIDGLPSGGVPLEVFKRHCQLPDVEEMFETFTKLLARADLMPTRAELKELLKREGDGWLSFEQWQELYAEEFRSYDANGDGVLCRSEMEKALRHWYGVTGKTIDLVFHVLDRDPDTDALTQEDLYMAMFVLVGVRGSISSKTSGEQLVPHEDPGSQEDIDARSTGGTTKLMSAASFGDVELVKALVSRGADVNAGDDYGWTPLRYAVRKKSFAVVKELLALGADVNKASKSGRTPLMSAVANGAENIVQLLVDSGADVNAKNRDGLTARDIASRGGGMGSSVVRALLQTA